MYVKVSQKTPVKEKEANDFALTGVFLGHLVHSLYVMHYNFSETKYSHWSPWPAFTATLQKNSVKKLEEIPGVALKESKKFNVCSKGYLFYECFP